jgi:PGF-pre-PGF domain-containing protein
MKQITKILITLLTALLLTQTATATSSLTIGTVTYDSTVVKDESLTLSTSIEASSVSSTITVTVTLQDNTGSAVSITSATKTLTFTQSETQNIQWSIRADTPGTYSSPFTITASASDGGNANPKTTTTSLTIQERPVLDVTTSQNKTSVNNGDTVRLNYTIQNTAASGAASATDITATLALPSGWSISTGANPQSISSLAAGGAQSSGYWILTATSPSSTNTITLTINSSLPGGTTTKTYTITGPSTSSSSTDSGSSGGGGGGGGGTSGEVFENIVVKERYYEHVYKDKETVYAFKAEGNPVSAVKITGNVNAGEILAMVEVLKDKSTFVEVLPEGDVYKHLNIWVGTTGFATSKNIKTAIIEFSVEKSWLEEHNAKPEDVVLQRYADDTWETLETTKTNQDDTKIYYQATTDHFSPFAITLKPKTTTQTTTKQTTKTTTEDKTPTTETTEGPAEQKESPGFTMLAVLSVFLLYYMKRII